MKAVATLYDELRDARQRIAALEQAVTKIAEAAAPSRSDCIPCADIRRICAALVPQQEDAP